MTSALRIVGFLSAFVAIAHANAITDRGCIPVACFADPCQVSGGCDAYPQAKCVSNYCGGCNAEYFHEGRKVSCALPEPSSHEESKEESSAEEEKIVVGVCPRPKATAFGLCAEMCNNCAAKNQLCCSNGCGHQCMDPVKPDEEIKPAADISGFHVEEGCPPTGSFGACIVSCKSHDECGESGRCCSTGCGRVCKPLYLGNTTTQPITKPTLSCPKLLEGQLGACVVMCSSHSQCGEGKMCCSNGCGQTCQTGVDLTKQQPKARSFVEEAQPVVAKRDFPIRYSCPKLEDGGMGLCMSNCESDDDCNGGSTFMNNGTMKCCSNGCGKLCVPGIVPLKTGSCPTSPKMGPCIMSCAEHANCADDLLCCPHGCGQICKKPAQP